ncbi:hypothetical protein [Micromonospora cremea]|uniref:hypothetical protein n=1 Tax=Micromonospora cremea TaxID=709881 RepID=UPI000A7F2EAB|nr:hypothetical protein [Micromonospora cremea]
MHVKQGRFFNHYMNPAGPFDANPVTPPVLWMPQNEISNSPSTPLYLTSGRYAGQFVIGDVTYGGLQRANLEKVNGEYQGALFRLTQGLEAGVSEVNVGPDGAIYVGGLGAGGNWGQTGKLSYGLQKLTPNSATTFEMLAMRATTAGFEVEYTQPVSAETAANLAAHYKIKQWRYQATSSYGGPKIDEETLTVTSATLSADGKKVTLAVNGRKAGHVVYLRSPRPFTSTTGSRCGAPKRGTRSTPSQASPRRRPAGPTWRSTRRPPRTAPARRPRARPRRSTAAWPAATATSGARRAPRSNSRWTWGPATR